MSAGTWPYRHPGRDLLTPDGSPVKACRPPAPGYRAAISVPAQHTRMANWRRPHPQWHHTDGRGSISVCCARRFTEFFGGMPHDGHCLLHFPLLAL